ncbi:MAG: hypothetical protein GX677_01045 [Treponema sp.]|nr:hypothetical protein [Treponema sp.]
MNKSIDPLDDELYYKSYKNIGFDSISDEKLDEYIILNGKGIKDTSKPIKSISQADQIVKDIPKETKTDDVIRTKPLTETIQQNIETNKTSKDTKKQIINSKTGEAYTLNKPKETKMTGNFYRNIRSLFDEKSAKKITGDFDQAKLDYIKRNNQLANELFKRTKQYNIKKGSKDSALVQQYGEGIITLEELKQKTKNWKNVVEFDKWFRTNYDAFIDNINNVRKSIYPNVEKSIAEYKEKLQKTYSQIEELSKDTQKNAKRIIKLKLKANSYETILENDELLRNKRVVKRKDYYRHFQEMSQGLGALQNIMSTSSDIPAQMVGVSDFTKPNTKFSTIALRRKGTKTKYDAVGGFLNYIPTANYMISIDPQINVLRSLTKDIQQQMGDDTSANKAIEFLTEFTNKLAGKQNFLDRAVTKVTGRKILKGISWLSGRIKSNLILGNASSSLSQVLNLPQIVGKIKSPKLLLNGFKDSFSKTDYSKSQFITERYESDILSQFDEGVLKKPKKFALWMLEALDEKVTKTGWNAFYREAINKDIKNPEQYADDNIRDMVAGRGIGEITMLQESKVIGLIAPFTVEVGNMNTVLKGMLKDKKFLDLFITFVVARLLNEGIKQIGGGGSTIDPIKAVWEATTEKDLTMLERFGRIAGEIASNIPMGQVLATLYPEYGTDYLPTRKQLFGDNDPTRFGTGSMFSKAFSSPVTTLVTPWGGAQFEKTIKGLSMFEKAVPGSYNNSGKLRFPVEDTPIKKIQSALFGEYGTSEANEYFDKNRRPLSDTQLNELKYSDNIKRDYEKIMKIREENKK